MGLLEYIWENRLTKVGTAILLEEGEKDNLEAGKLTIKRLV